MFIIEACQKKVNPKIQEQLALARSNETARQGGRAADAPAACEARRRDEPKPADVRTEEPKKGGVPSGSVPGSSAVARRETVRASPRPLAAGRSGSRRRRLWRRRPCLHVGAPAASAGASAGERRMNDQPSKPSSPFTAFQWDDALRLDAELSEDERAIRDTARDFCQEKLFPRVLLWRTAWKSSIARS